MVLVLEAALFEAAIGTMTPKTEEKENAALLLNFEHGRRHQTREEVDEEGQKDNLMTT
jgi:hypothetical protein